MLTVIIVIHLILAIALVGTVLLQRSEGGGLGMGGGGGGGGGMGGFMTGRDTANFLTRTTGVLAAGFMSTSLILAIMAGGDRNPTSIMDKPAAVEEPAEPVEPDGPKVPQAQ
ncbi:MAG: preprotein translocase subunit SecG [Rhodospirillaceae bacterium]|jgi:preprotein translocase subunit SecG|nr:preprotein translocase subunit SecG [Rhodospirillaceae bacterium]MBT5245421.1 preprotein translocase subunit SecG [Rhodospirillaceae bacterium]MBT5562577.1 preprotein translocase subunit SecG [Rhodospirillaceae bacterium]MBT6242565.1 preprotein translocase subunit SecG [Rhodospirillaceae bacterium]MBT7137214.1 preprotein translocase subunit SecG [Rhodospirillaceae bacterium]